MDTLIFQERYAEGVGMISKRTQDTNTQFPSGVLRTKGVYFTMSIVAFGNE